MGSGPGEKPPLFPGPPFFAKGQVSYVVPAESWAALVSIPAAIAVIVTVREFLKYMGDQRALDRTERAADRLLWENHLSKTVEVLNSLVHEIREMRAERQRDLRRV